jgi:hypothetical protein
VIASDQASKLPISAADLPGGLLASLARRLGGVDLRVVILAIVTFGALAAAFGIYHLQTSRVDPGASTDFFDLDGERTFVTVLTGASLLAAALGALVAGYLVVGRARYVFHSLAGFFAFMALDEVFSFHESIERTTGVDWQLLYLPIFLIGAVGGIGALVLLRGLRAAQLTFLAGGLAWLVAQVFEQIQWGADDEPIAHYNLLMVPEELLEYLGSALWFVAFVLVIRHVLAQGARAPAAVAGD